MSFTLPFFLGPVLFRTTLPCSGGYHLERGEIPLHDAVGINCKKGSATENQDADVKYMDQVMVYYYMKGKTLSLSRAH